jgi:hypothetical protein
VSMSSEVAVWEGAPLTQGCRYKWAVACHLVGFCTVRFCTLELRLCLSTRGNLGSHFNDFNNAVIANRRVAAREPARRVLGGESAA